MRVVAFLIFIIVSIYGCKVMAHRKGVYVRIVNVDTVKTKGYKIDKYTFSGLNPGDTSEYQFMQKFSIGYSVSVTIDKYVYSQGNIGDCRKCDVDTPKHITVKIMVIDKEKRIPKVIHVP